MSVFMGLVVLVMSKRIPLVHMPYILMVKYAVVDEGKLDSALKKNCSKFKVRNTMLEEAGGEKTIEARVKRGQENKLLQEIKAIKGVKKVVLFTHEGELAE